MIDYAALNNSQLADAYNAATREYAVTGNEEPLVFAENEIAGRLDIPLDETEQGFTAQAHAKIEKFVQRYRLGEIDGCTPRDLA